MADHSFAAKISGVTPAELISLERVTGRDERFADVDRLLSSLLASALSGAKILEITTDETDPEKRSLITLAFTARNDRAYVEEMFSLSAQQSRGAWFLPEAASLRARSLNLPAYLRKYPMHAITLSSEETARVRLGSTADAMVTWGALIPLFEVLMAPIIERAAGSTEPTAAQEARWNEITQSHERLGIQANSAFSIFTYRGGWGSLGRADQTRAREALLDALAGLDPLEIARRFRADCISALAAVTLRKSKRSAPIGRKVLTRALYPVLSAYFGGSWLELLDYLELSPHPNEEVVTALPRPALFVGGSTNAAAVAAEHGLEAAEVHAMLAAFLGQETSVSPVDSRVNVLTRWWSEFVAIHACQAVGMPSLWGLIEEGPYTIEYEPESMPQPTPQLYKDLLSPDLLHEISELWSGIILPRWPQTVVSEAYPHKLLAETLGPAAAFWHGVALTAWYTCEGPYTRVPLTALRNYHDRDLTALNSAGTPVDPSLFDELQEAERHLGAPQDLKTYEHRLNLPDGKIGFRFSGGGQRRDGFQFLHNIIVHHLREWSAQHFTSYLKCRWTEDLTAVSREFGRFMAAKGNAPTLRQFARMAAPAANHWFNGDLTCLYSAIGERSPASPCHAGPFPVDVKVFIEAVYAELGGLRYHEHLRITDFPLADRYRQQSRLATASIRYLQVSQALGRPPDPAEFGAARHEWEWSNRLDEGWPIYQRAIGRVFERLTAG